MTFFSKNFFADSALMPTAHTVIYFFSLLNSLTLYIRSLRGTLIEFFIFPDLNSDSVLTSIIIAPSSINSLMIRSGFLNIDNFNFAVNKREQFEKISKIKKIIIFIIII